MNVYFNCFTDQTWSNPNVVLVSWVCHFGQIRTWHLYSIRCILV